MFNTEIIHLLQSIDNQWFKLFMEFISMLGLSPIVIIISLGILFSISFKRGLVLVNILGITALFTVFLKTQINYPRPFETDHQVISQYEKSDQDLKHLLPKGFWELFGDELLSHTQNDELESHGFPSGHTSLQTALWFGLLLLFRKRWIAYLSILMIVLTMISRMYLGHHFLGDVIGGFFLGAFITGSIWLLCKQTKFLTTRFHSFNSLSLLWLPGILFFGAPFFSSWILSSIIGINAAAILTILQRNFPVYHVILWKRILSGLLTIFLFFVVFYLGRFIPETNIAYIDLFLLSGAYFLAVRGGLSISRRLMLIRFRN